ncbi:MAG: LysM peptidoglycan-binding protein [Acidimicrobiales bacterium]|nr:LysM peptidoglycan-binding protein [Acidimicrobiales bacterium]
MLWRMRSRVVAVGLSAVSLLGVAACGSSAGTGAPPATTILLGPPSYQTLVPATSTIPPATLPGDPGAVVTNEQSYTLKSGDYLYGIAKSYCVKAQDIADYNGWTDDINTHQLVPGVSIKIPPNGCAYNSATAATSAPIVTTVATAAATSTTFDVASGGTYKVVSGDYLGGIAKKTGATVDGIVAANGWADGAAHVIIPGQTIKLPAKTG